MGIKPLNRSQLRSRLLPLAPFEIIRSIIEPLARPV
jgi:hypothetical protein